MCSLAPGNNLHPWNNFAEVSQSSILTAKHFAVHTQAHTQLPDYRQCDLFAIVPSPWSGCARRNERRLSPNPHPHSLTRINISCDERTRQRIKSATYISAVISRLIRSLSWPASNFPPTQQRTKVLEMRAVCCERRCAVLNMNVKYGEAFQYLNLVAVWGFRIGNLSSSASSLSWVVDL